MALRRIFLFRTYIYRVWCLCNKRFFSHINISIILNNNNFFLILLNHSTEIFFSSWARLKGIVIRICNRTRKTNYNSSFGKANKLSVVKQSFKDFLPIKTYKELLFFTAVNKYFVYSTFTSIYRSKCGPTYMIYLCIMINSIAKVLIRLAV